MTVIERFPEMNALVRLAIIGLAVLGLPGVAGAQTASVTVTVAQALAAPIILEFLRFGGITSGSESGTVIVLPDLSAEREATGGAKLTSASDFGPAVFAISGESAASYSIISFSGPTASREGPASSENVALVVMSLTSATASVGVGKSGTLSPDGTDTILIGGTLVVPANAPGGRYEAEIELTINY